MRCNDREAAGEGWYPRHSYLHSYPHFGAQAIPYPTGDPNLPPEKEMNRRREIVMGALNLLTEGGGSVSGENNAVFTD
mgnify:CR=1 FL=1